MMRKLLFLLLLIFPIMGMASERLRHFNVIDGLSSSEVTSICEGKSHLWIATTDGLNRFDGHSFKVYKRNANGNSISENNIESLMFDSRGMLWIGLKSGGVDIYNPRKDEFTHLSKFVSGTIPYRVISIFEDSSGNIWLGTWGEGAYKLTPRDRNATWFDSEEFMHDCIVSGFAEKPKGEVWIGSYTGVAIYDLSQVKIIEQLYPSAVITSVLDMGEYNRLLFSTWNMGVISLEWNGAKPEAASIRKSSYLSEINAVYNLAGPSIDKMYIGTWGEGLIQANIADKITARSLRNESFTSTLIYSLLYDKHSNVWVGTYGDGLYMFNSEDFGVYTFPSETKDKIPASVGRMSYLGDGKVMVGTLGAGFYICDIVSRELKKKNLPIAKGKAFMNNTLGIYVDDNIVIAGHDGEGFLYSSTADARKPNALFKEITATSLDKITSIHKGNDGRIWMGTKQSGLTSFRYNPRNNTFEDRQKYESLSRGEITGFVEQDLEHMWISSHAGLFLFNTATNNIDKEGVIIDNEMVYSILKDKKKNILWIGSSRGVSQIELNNGYTIEHMFQPELVPQGSVKNMVLDSQNNLWFTTSGRIFCYKEETKSILEINPMAFNNMSATSCLRIESKGHEFIIFGSTAELIVVDPQKILSKEVETGIVFSNIQIDHKNVKVGEKVYGKILLTEDTEYTTSIELSYRCKWISLSLTNVNSGIFENKFQYRIKGFSDNWQYLDIVNPITFSQLAPGQYTIEVRTIEGENQAGPCWSLQMYISPPWWQTVWFRVVQLLALIGLLISLIFYFKHYYKKRQVKRARELEKRKKEELLQEKESFFAGLSHDLMTPFSLIIAPANDLLRNNSAPNDEVHEKLEIIAKNASFLSDIFGTILDVKRAEITDSELTEKQIEIVALVRHIVEAFDYMACSRSITLELKTNIDRLNIVIDNVKLERILYNLLSNAIKYTPNGGHVGVELSVTSDNELYVSVKDSGPGIAKMNHSKVFEKFYREPKYIENSSGLGLGLYIVRRFASMLGGEIEVESDRGQGTKITLKFTPRIIPEVVDLPPEISDKECEINTEAIEAKTTILVVEDNDDLRHYLQGRLSTYFHVISASNGIEALGLTEQNVPEIVITDIMMPEMDGLTLTEKIKKNPMLADIFVVILTAKSSSEDELRGYKAGVDIYLKKPFDSDALINQIVNIYNTRKHRREQLLGELASPLSGDPVFDSKEAFLSRAMKIVEEHIMDVDFKIDEFASEMNLSKTVLHRKFKILIGHTPNIFIRMIRLRKAVSMLQSSDLTIAEIAYLTGFKQSHYFIKCFRETYNDTPKNFRKQYSTRQDQ